MKTFVLMPLRREHDEIYYKIIKPSIEAAVSGMICLRADEIGLAGSILRDIISGIAGADVVVADLTDRNPNVFYELGIAHSISEKTVMITRDMGIPFDVRVYRVIQYDTTGSGLERLGEQLKQAVYEIVSESSRIFNPVSDFLGPNIIKPSPQLFRAVLPIDRGFAGALINRDYHSSIRHKLYQDSTCIEGLKIYINFSFYPWLKDILFDGINHNKKFRYLMCHPKIIEHLAGLDAKPAQIRKDDALRAREDIEFFRKFKEQVPMEKRNAVHMRLYSDVPAWCIYRYDDEMYVSPYLYGVQGSQTLCLHLKKSEHGPGYFEQFEGHYNEVWDASEPI